MWTKRHWLPVAFSPARIIRKPPIISERLLGLADRREDNGLSIVTEEYEAELFAVVPGSPRKHGYRRPTWPQELLILVLRRRMGIRISRTTMSRLLKRLKNRLGRPKPIVGCPWKKRRRTAEYEGKPLLAELRAACRRRSNELNQKRNAYRKQFPPVSR